MLSIQAVPAAAFFLLLFRIPESPRWLLRRGRVEEGRPVLARIDPDTANRDVIAILTANAIDTAGGG